MDKFNLTPEELDALSISQRYGHPERREAIMERRRRRRERLRRVLLFWRS
jgi:hypothetical protein